MGRVFAEAVRKHGSQEKIQKKKLVIIASKNAQNGGGGGI